MWETWVQSLAWEDPLEKEMEVVPGPSVFPSGEPGVPSCQSQFQSLA